MDLFQSATKADALPLSDHVLFKGDDIDEARAAVAEVYCDHRLETIGRQPFAAQHNRISGKALSINVMTYGAKTLIAPGALEGFYLFQFPVRGHASINNGTNRHEIGGGTSGVINPEASTSMIWSEDCVQVMLQIEKKALIETARAEVGLPAGTSLQFAGANKLRNGEGRAFLGLLNFIMKGSEGDDALLGSDTLLGKQLERTLMVGLLQTQSHNFSSIVASNTGPMPRIIRSAESYMHENLRAPIMIEDIACAAGTSVRNLQGAFRNRYGRSPMTVLRDLRLELAWEELSNPTQTTRVTDVATELGFFHLGRFAEIYRKKFGCTPVETLRAALPTEGFRPF
ncbi:AraC family transcriptional regulator [Falsihalocynthiibacter sp. BN13B15]|uniref:AraC family transcriptional regulator n=1 Tax=Falsihalocynthiibacter sp. BN13B15 TaxID=3240871 RepID=UPI00350F509D